MTQPAYENDALFVKAMSDVIQWEGGFANNPNDNGGATNFGISLRFYKESIDPMADEKTIRELTKEDAMAIYYEHWWEPKEPNSIRIKYRALPFPIAKKLFNLAINMGQKRANKLLQRALWAATGKELVIDGLIGEKTMQILVEANNQSVLAALKSEAAGRYKQIAALDPSQKVFLKGWLRRAYS